MSVPPPSLYSWVLGVTSSPTANLVLLGPWCACPTSVLVLAYLWFEGSKVVIMCQWLGWKFRLLLLGKGQSVLFDGDRRDFWGFCSPCFAKTPGAVFCWHCGCLMKECQCYSIPHFSHSEDFRAGTGCPESVPEHCWCREDQLCVLADHDSCSGCDWETLCRGLSTPCLLLRWWGLAGSRSCGNPFP